MTEQRSDSGFIMVTMVIILLPLTLIVAASLSSMGSRTARVREEIVQEKAFLAAEAGLDAALYRARTIGLTDGGIFVRAFGRGSAFSVESTYLGRDGIDNDGDTLVDESDEDVYQLIIRGTYRGVIRRIAAYLGTTSILPQINGALLFQNPLTTIQLNGSPVISGNDTNIDGSLGNSDDDVPGMVISPPGVTMDLLAELDSGEQDSVQGIGGSPSLGISVPVDVDRLAADAKNAASIILTNSTYSGFDFGDASASPPTGYITYREGDVIFDGNARGAGLLVVTGDLTISGTFRFDGVIVVLGNLINSAGTAQIYGGILLGTESDSVMLKGTADIRFSMEALALSNTLTSRYVAFNGWQELSRK